MTTEVRTDNHQKNPFVSVLIATRNRPNDLAHCLESVLAQDYHPYEIVIVDQSTSDASEKAVREKFGSPENLCHIRSNEVGKSRALNQLLDSGKGEIFAFTDDDTLTPTDWLTKIVRIMRENPEAGILFGPVHAANEPDENIEATPSLYFDTKRYLELGETFGMGANMGMRREVAELEIRFDTQLGPGTPIPAAEEGDYIYRLQRAGVRILLEPTATLIHLAGRNKEEWDKVMYGYGAGDAAFALKHLRCGDWRIARRLPGVLYVWARGCLRIVQRKPRAELRYARGYWDGVWKSLRLGVDKKTRLFHSRSDAGRAA